MKKFFKYISPVLFIVTMGACHKIDVTPKSLYTEDVFPQTEEQFQALIGPVYTSLRGHFALTYFFMTECSTDEAILPAFGGNWYDGASYEALHRHAWTPDHNWVTTAWNDVTGLIGTCNQTLYILNNAPEGDAKNTSMAEVRMIRAYAYWELMDFYGGVPLDTVYPSPGLQARASRADIFNFVESELKTVIPYLKTEVDASTYGKPTQYFAYSLLAKLYLNAEVYTGSAKNDECIAACDAIISSGKYSVQSRDSYLKMFYPDNGPTTQSEFIFAIPYDPSTSSGYLFYGRYDLNRNLGMKYKYSGATVGTNVDPVVNQTTGNGLVNSKPSGPRATLSTFLDYFLADENDIRLKQWLYGPQYWDNGNPIMVKTTNLGYNQFYSGSDGGSSYVYHLNIDTSIKLRQNPALFDCGNDEIAWNQGARNIKFFPDAGSTTRNQNNDAPVSRYSDVLLMKAEAILRGGAATSGQTALSLVNMVRAERTKSPGWASVDLEDLYEERCREFAWECLHRNDMIRFGKYENLYGFKTNTDTYRRLFPIPTTAITANGKLEQNTGY
ncbi:MAG: RagB/SusD family nutrient uptake outer membrane protein [Terrimonas sp.]|nr:RagB/SusD family nutrient uptake outer membrane protein [Terrimonas sp.]OJY93835.1 MAG: RagB/SusD family nutrient uptake outer membrane protein [Sphingobacteriales bacterium 40-81]